MLSMQTTYRVLRDMRRKEVTAVIIAFAMIMPGTLIVMGDIINPFPNMPGLPYEVWGVAYYDGNPIPEGESIHSWSDGVQYGNCTIDPFGLFTLDTMADDTVPDAIITGCWNGDIIYYSYDLNGKTYYANQTSIWLYCGSTNTNLIFYAGPAELKINEICSDDGSGDQYAVIYNPTMTNVTLDDYYLEKNDQHFYHGPRFNLTGTIGPSTTCYIDLGSTGFLNASADELKLAWNNPGTAVAGSNDIVIDRVEYGVINTIPDSTSLPNAPALSPGTCIRRTPDGQDTDDCLMDFALSESLFSGYVTHAPIRINSNAEFASMALAEGWKGSGIEADPYIIENYDINGTGYGYCIYIGNTTNHFQIRDSYLHHASGYYIAPYFVNSSIILYNVQNANLINNIMTNSDVGIRLFYSSYNVVNDNNVSNNNGGIVLQYSCNNTLIDNNAFNCSTGFVIGGSSNGNNLMNNVAMNGYEGFSIRTYSNDTYLVNNIAMNNTFGFEFLTTNNNYIENNSATWNNAYGMLFSSMENSTITGNNVSNNNCGLNLTLSDNNHVFENIVSNNVEDIGLSICNSNNNIVENNIINNNGIGLLLSSSIQTITSRKPIDVVFALDTSASMTGESLAWLKIAAKNFIGMMNDNDRVALWKFSGDSNTNPQLSRAWAYMTQANRTSFNATIDAYAATGFTPLYDTMGEAITYSLMFDLTATDPSRLEYVVAFTDGQSNYDDYWTPEANWSSTYTGADPEGYANAGDITSGNGFSGGIGHGLISAPPMVFTIGLGITHDPLYPTAPDWSRTGPGVTYPIEYDVWHCADSTPQDTGSYGTNISSNEPYVGHYYYTADSNLLPDIFNTIVVVVEEIGSNCSTTFSSDNNLIRNNEIQSNDCGIMIGSSNDNSISHNNFIDNANQSFDDGYNNWNDGYPSGGNYWSDNAGIDIMSGLLQNIPSSDGIGDTPYVIDADSRDDYPLMEPLIDGRVQRPPIRIDSNVEFNAEHGVSAGSGTEADPYIIENYDINGTGYSYCIYIGNTSNYFIIKNCYVHNSLNASNETNVGVKFYKVEQGGIYNSKASSNQVGIYLVGCNNISINKNNISQNLHHGLQIDGMANSIISNNSIYDNEIGELEVKASECNNVSFFNNVIGYGTEYGGGIISFWSQNLIMKNNTLASGIDVLGDNILHWNTHIIDTSNTVDGRPIVYWKNQTNGTIPPNAGEIILANCTNIKVINQNFLHFGRITLGFSKFNYLEDNIFNNSGSINLWSDSEYNIITNNTFSNGTFGVYLNSWTNNTPSYNQIYHNSFISNTDDVYIQTIFGLANFTNTWDNGYPSGGNYWSEYNGTDLYSGPLQDIPGSDGIGDTPYDGIGDTVWVIDGNSQDNYPLMAPWGQVQTVSDLSIVPEDISFSEPDPSKWDTVTISAEIHNGDLDSDWPMFGHDAAHSGCTDSPGPIGNQTLWNNDYGPIYMPGTSSPSVGEDLVYVTTQNITHGMLLALDKFTGSTEWDLDMGVVSLSQSLVIGDFIYLVQRKSDLNWENRWTDTTCINKNTRQTVWTSRLNYTDNLNSPPEIIAENGLIYLAFNIDLDSNLSDINYVAIQCLDGTNGNIVWVNNFTADRSPSSHPPLAIGGSIVFFPGYNGVYGLDKMNGDLLWDFAAPALTSTVASISNGRVMFGVRNHIYCLQEGNGSVIWDKLLGSNIYPTPTAIDQGNLIVALSNFTSRQTSVLALSIVDGSTIWTTPMYPEDYVDAPAIAGGIVYVGFIDYLRAFNEATGAELWQSELLSAGTIQYPNHCGFAISEGILYMTSGLNYVYAFGTILPSSQNNATCTVSFYLDFIASENLLCREYEVLVPAKGSAIVSYDWLANITGDHEIIVAISDTVPEDRNLTNNIASKAISISEPCGKLKVKASSDKQKYITGTDDQAEIIVKVTYLGNPIGGADVSCIVTDPNDIGTSVSLTEAYEGIYVGTYPFTNASVIGTYRINTIATKLGYLQGENNDAKDKFFLDSPVPQMSEVSSVALSANILAGGTDLTVTANILNPTGVESIFATLSGHGRWGTFVRPMFDDGTHSDAAPGDGVFTALFDTGDMSDTYTLDISINGLVNEKLDAIVVSPTDYVAIDSFTGMQTAASFVEIASSLTNVTIDLNTVSDISGINFLIVEHRNATGGKDLEFIPSGNAIAAMIYAHIEVSYAEEDIPANVSEDSLTLWVYNIYTERLEPCLPSGVDILSDLIWGDTEHFSEFKMVSTPVGMSAHTIQLTPGWNLISIPIQLDNEAIDRVLSPITGLWDVAKYYDGTDPADPWKTYRVGSSLNDLHEVDHTMALWVHVSSSAQLPVFGVARASTQISLHTGWNFVGYPTLHTGMTVGDALWGTGADKVEVFNPASPTFIMVVGSTYILSPGMGLWVHVAADSVWTVNG